MAGAGRSNERALARYLRTEVLPYSARYGPVLARGSAPTLEGVPPSTLAEAGDGTSLVLRPDEERMGRSGSVATLARLAWAQLTRRQHALNRWLEPRYKPVTWWLADGTRMGASAADEARLAEMGERWLRALGLESHGALVSIVAPGPRLPYWQLVAATRRMGLPSLFLDAVPAPEQLAALGPSAVAGAADELLALLVAAPDIPALRAVLVVGERLDDGMRTALQAAAGPGVVVVAAWAPAGVRSMWVECPAADGFHTWPATEVLESIDGELVWSALGWRGSVLLRLRTGVVATLDHSSCGACELDGPRLHLAPSVPSFTLELVRHPGVAEWQVELRCVDGVEELLVFLAPTPGTRVTRLVRELDLQLSATQYVVLDDEEMDARLERSGGSRVLDLR